MMPFILHSYFVFCILKTVLFVLSASSSFLQLKFENRVLTEIRCCVILCQTAILPRHPELYSDLSVTNTAGWTGSGVEIHVGDFGLTVSRQGICVDIPGDNKFIKLAWKKKKALPGNGGNFFKYTRKVVGCPLKAKGINELTLNVSFNQQKCFVYIYK